MQAHEVVASSGAALALGCIHTLLGPDHYAPFIALARIGNWSTRKTLVVTLTCGVGHVGSSVLIGLIGVWLGVEVLKLQSIESIRGDFAAWLLLAFGLTYTAWGIWRGLKNHPHAHMHIHADGTAHSHEHVHRHEHAHPHHSADSNNSQQGKRISLMTPWILFTIFVFGPCEPLIPLLFYPAARGELQGVLWVASLFAVSTIGTMVIVVLALSQGMKAFDFSKFERFDHAIAGSVVMMCGVAVMLGF
jgi:ABC-type nickel/cobalt efflux system permease component RcnA